MPVVALIVVSLILLGNVIAGGPSAPSQELAAPAAAAEPDARLVNLQTELSAPMFHGTVQSIDRETLRVTIRTDFGRLVPVTVERCEIIERLRIGDRVRLDVDAQGVIRALERTDFYLAKAPQTPPLPTGTGGRCLRLPYDDES